MANVLVEKSTLTAVADAIRAKAGIESKLKPGDMPTAIEEISTGKAGPNESDPYRFYDFDGTLLHSYTQEEMDELTELPPFPFREGFTYQMWNWTLEGLKALHRPMSVGANCVTSDGATRVYVHVVHKNVRYIVGFSQDKADGVKVSWGDGSEVSTSSTVEVNTYSPPASLSHIYAEPGDYVITFMPDDDVSWQMGPGGRTIVSTDGTGPDVINTVIKIELGAGIGTIKNNCFTAMNELTAVNFPAGITLESNCMRDSSIEWISFPYHDSSAEPLSEICNSMKALRGCALGENDIVSDYAFGSCIHLERVDLPEGLVEVPGSAFYSCSNLKIVNCPRTITSIGKYAFCACKTLAVVDTQTDSISVIGNSAFSECNNLKKISFHSDGITQLGVQCFQECYRLSTIPLSDKMTEIPKQAFKTCKGVSAWNLPSGLLKIGYGAFTDNDGLAELDIPESVTEIAGTFALSNRLKKIIVRAKVPPTVTASTLGFMSTVRIYVPKGTLEAYSAAELWNNYSSQFVEMDE